MGTTIHGLDNAKTAGETLSYADWNGIADDTEWMAGGYLSLSVAGGAGDTTLTQAQYETNVLVLTGALTGNRGIIVPTTHSGRRWLVYNNTSGAYTGTVKTAAGTGVAITQGYAALVACDGTNVIRLGPDSAITSASSVAVTSPRIVTGINDTNGNELLKVTATASAVNEATLTNGATGSGPVIEATGDDTNIPITLKAKGTGDVLLGISTNEIGFFGVAAVVRPSAYTQTYATADKTHANQTQQALTDNSGGSASTTLAAITGGGAGCENATKDAVASLAARLAEVKADMLDLKQLVNSVIDDLQALGLLQ